MVVVGDSRFSLLGQKQCDKVASCSSPEVESGAAPFFLPLSSKSRGYFHKLKGMNRTCGAVVASLVPSPRRNAGRPLPTWRRIEMALGTAGSSSPSAGAVLRVRPWPCWPHTRGGFTLPCNRPACAPARSRGGDHPLHTWRPRFSCRIAARSAVAQWEGAGLGSVMMLGMRGFREAPTD